MCEENINLRPVDTSTVSSNGRLWKALMLWQRDREIDKRQQVSGSINLMHMHILVLTRQLTSISFKLDYIQNVYITISISAWNLPVCWEVNWVKKIGMDQRGGSYIIANYRIHFQDIGVYTCKRIYMVTLGFYIYNVPHKHCPFCDNRILFSILQNRSNRQTALRCKSIYALQHHCSFSTLEWNYTYLEGQS